MPRTSGASPGADRRGGQRPGAAVLAVTLLACGPRDARVGAGAPATLDGGEGGAHGEGGGGAAGGATPIFSAEMASNDGAWSVVESLPKAQAVFGASATGTDTHDGRVAVLLFPGGGADPDPTTVGAGAGPGIVSAQSFRYGTFRARVRWATTCTSGEELISVASLRASDGQDGDGDGIIDLHQLDLQIPCSAPSYVVMSAWSDYQRGSLGQETFRKRSRAVDTATGDVYDTLVAGEAGFTKTGQSADLAHPGFPDPGPFYDLGIAWQADHVRFFVTIDAHEVTLWDLTDPAYVPQVPLAIAFQLWHPAVHWFPAATPANVPSFEGLFAIDWAAWFSR